MSQALYRKYRSKNLAEIVGQDHITTTLARAIKAGRISHAYLFTGPRGVGKTSIARILAHELNDIPYTDESIHLDIIEIDAASSRRIDEIRDLRDKVHISPTSAKYKIYIIDEVHMLTREAFNALLKTLEEPPAHCIFILATTEAHKLPQTIVSRTQRFSFQPISKADLKKHLKQIAETEAIKINDEALELLAEHGDGSFRDSIGLLDQVSSVANEITAKEVLQLLGVPPTAAIENLLDTLNSGQLDKILAGLNELRDQGFTAGTIAAQLSKLIRKQLLDGQATTLSPALLKELLLVATSPQPQELLEIVLLSVKSTEPAKISEPVNIRKINNEGVDYGLTKKIDPNSNQKNSEKPVTSKEVETAKSPKILSSDFAEFNLDLWPSLLQKAKQKTPSLYTALRLAEPRFSAGLLTLAFQFPLHQKKLNQTSHKHIISDLLNEVGFKIERLECVVDKALKPQLAKAALEPVIVKTIEGEEDAISAINNIFGSAEVLES